MSLFAGVDALPAPNDPLVSSDDFVEWYGLSPTTGDLNRIQTALEIASAEIRTGRRLFSPVTDELVVVDSYGGTSLLLPRNRLPVTNVSLVEELSGDAYVAVDASEYDWSADGYVTRWWTTWSSRPQGVRVTYSHGYDVMPRDVAGACLSLAGRLYQNPSNASIQSEQLGDHHITYSTATGGLLPDEKLSLQFYESRA